MKETIVPLKNSRRPLFKIDDETGDVSAIEHPLDKVYEDQRLFDNRLRLLALLLGERQSSSLMRGRTDSAKTDNLITELMRQLKVKECEVEAVQGKSFADETLRHE
nr:hypothetical protein [Paenibacillus xylanexedens]